MQPVKGVGGDRVVHPPAASLGGDQPGLAEHLEMVGQQIALDGGDRLEFADAGGGSAGEVGQQPPPDWIGDGGQQPRRFNRYWFKNF